MSVFSSDTIDKYFKGFYELTWNFLLILTPFTLPSNALCDSWNKCYELSRRLQGKLNGDFNISFSCHDSSLPC